MAKPVNKTLIKKIVVSALVIILITAVFIFKKQQNPSDGNVSANEAAEGGITPDSAFRDNEFENLHVISVIDYSALRSSGLPVIIDFGADSCVPCREMAPVLEELNKSLKGKAIIKFVDVWKYRDLAEGIPLQVIPTQVFFDAEGKPFSPPESLQIDFKIYSLKDTNEHIFTTHEGGLSKDQMTAILNAMGMK